MSAAGDQTKTGGTPSMINARLCTVTLALALLNAPGLLAAPAAEPSGAWLTEGGKATVRLVPRGPALCGTIVALKEPNDPATGRPHTDKNNPDPNARNKPLIGVQIVLGM